MMNDQMSDTGAMTHQLSVSVEIAYAADIKAKSEGTSTVAPNATYLRRSQAGQASRLSVAAPESQKKTRSRR